MLASAWVLLSVTSTISNAARDQGFGKLQGLFGAERAPDDADKPALVKLLFDLHLHSVH